jgi:hypothetical protein
LGHFILNHDCRRPAAAADGDGDDDGDDDVDNDVDVDVDVEVEVEVSVFVRVERVGASLCIVLLLDSTMSSVVAELEVESYDSLRCFSSSFLR